MEGTVGETIKTRESFDGVSGRRSDSGVTWVESNPSFVSKTIDQSPVGNSKKALSDLKKKSFSEKPKRGNSRRARLESTSDGGRLRDRHWRFVMASLLAAIDEVYWFCQEGESEAYVRDASRALQQGLSDMGSIVGPGDQFKDAGDTDGPRPEYSQNEVQFAAGVKAPDVARRKNVAAKKIIFSDQVAKVSDAAKAADNNLNIDGSNGESKSASKKKGVQKAGTSGGKAKPSEPNIVVDPVSTPVSRKPGSTEDKKWAEGSPPLTTEELRDWSQVQPSPSPGSRPPAQAPMHVPKSKVVLVQRSEHSTEAWAQRAEKLTEGVLLKSKAPQSGKDALLAAVKGGVNGQRKTETDKGADQHRDDESKRRTIRGGVDQSLKVTRVGRAVDEGDLALLLESADMPIGQPRTAPDSPGRLGGKKNAPPVGRPGSAWSVRKLHGAPSFQEKSFASVLRSPTGARTERMGGELAHSDIVVRSPAEIENLSRRLSENTRYRKSSEQLLKDQEERLAKAEKKRDEAIRKKAANARERDKRMQDMRRSQLLKHEQLVAETEGRQQRAAEQHQDHVEGIKDRGGTEVEKASEIAMIASLDKERKADNMQAKIEKKMEDTEQRRLKRREEMHKRLVEKIDASQTEAAKKRTMIEEDRQKRHELAMMKEERADRHVEELRSGEVDSLKAKAMDEARRLESHRRQMATEAEETATRLHKKLEESEQRYQKRLSERREAGRVELKKVAAAKERLRRQGSHHEEEEMEKVAMGAKDKAKLRKIRNRIAERAKGYEDVSERRRPSNVRLGKSLDALRVHVPSSTEAHAVFDVAKVTSELAELHNIIGREKEDDLHFLRQYGGLELLGQLTLLAQPPFQVKLHIFQVLALAISLPLNAAHVILSGKPAVDIVVACAYAVPARPVLAPAAGRKLTSRQEAIESELVPSALTVLTRLLKHRPATELEFRLQDDLVSVMFLTGLGERIRSRYTKICNPQDMVGHIPRFILGSLALIEAATCYNLNSFRNRAVWANLPFGGHRLSPLENSQFCGIPNLLYGLLTPGQRAPGNYTLTRDTLRVCTSGLRVLRNCCLLSVKQTVKALSEHGEQQLQHICSWLLEYYKKHSESGPAYEVLCEVLAVLGYYSLAGGQKEQEMFHYGSPPIAQRLCGLPIAFFSDARQREILFPTLILPAQADKHNLQVMLQELSPQMLIDFIDNHVDKLAPAKLKGVPNAGKASDFLSPSGLRESMSVPRLESDKIPDFMRIENRLPRDKALAMKEMLLEFP